MRTHKDDFRWDIQGLRAIAVLSVVIFHIIPYRLPGGFIGVDIFFVISGYLLIGFIYRDLQQGSFSLHDFYLRRIRRLLPALMLTGLVTTMGAYFLLLPAEFVGYSHSFIAAILYVSNFYFYSKSGYFDQELEISPLLHTWSLGVEEQFYIVMPVLMLWLFRKSPRRVPVMLGVLVLASLALSEFLVHRDASLSFYISPTRFWQFIIGGLISIYGPRVKVKPLISDLIGLSGLVTITLCMFTYNGEMLFPGVNALLPTLASGMILFSGSHQGITQFLLSIAPARFFGNISYSLYLWHWPVIVFYKLWIVFELGWKDKLVCLSLSVALGWLSWKFVERKFSDFVFPKLGYPITTALVSSVLVTAILLMMPDLVPNRYSEQQKEYASWLDYTEDGFRPGLCFLQTSSQPVTLYSASQCITHQEGKANILLLGDSHAAHWFEAMEQLRGKHETLSQLTAAGCRPLLAYKGAENCTQLMRWAHEDLIPQTRFDRIILSARWKLRELTSIRETALYLSQYADEVVILGPTVEYDMALPRLLALYENQGDLESHRLYQHVKGIDDALSKSFVDQQNIRYYSIFRTICPSRTQCLTTTNNGIPLAFDYGHLTLPGALYLLETLGLWTKQHAPAMRPTTTQ